MFVSEIIRVENVLVSSAIADTPFSCDLSKCKGACCTIDSKFGAPLLEEEILEIEELLGAIKDIIPGEHLEIIEDKGFFQEIDGEFMTRSFNEKACVFVYYDNGVAKCSIEKSYFDKKTYFRKPISCHLFPIRVSKFGGDILKYEKFEECNPAIENGKALNVTITGFCKESLSRKYGNKWYSKLIELIGK